MNEASPDVATRCRQLRRWNRGDLLIVWLTGLLLALHSEATRLFTRLIANHTPGNFWDEPALDGTWPLVLLMIAPFCFTFPCSEPRCLQLLLQAHRRLAQQLKLTCVRWCLCTGVALFSLAMDWSVSQRQLNNERVADLFPVMHDEFSYRFQARTFLAGRWHWPAPPGAPEIFHQMHVLSDDRIASRYFPGTGLWLAPWEALGHPQLAQWLAGMIIAAGIFWLGCELDSPAAGLLASLLVSAAPAKLIIGQMLVAHPPTLAALVIFLNAFFRWERTRQLRWAALAGSTLAFAMICRPLTAAAIGLPFGLRTLAWLFSSSYLHATPLQVRLRTALALGIPIFAGLCLVGWQNSAITDSVFETPYSRYTALYTPRHVFGFHNGSAIAAAPEKVLPVYNAWAENLTPARAPLVAWRRLTGSWQWWLGAVPLGMAAVASILFAARLNRNTRSLLWAILVLHAAHIPYWLDGLLQHHYVYESGPLWILLGSVLTLQLFRAAVRNHHFLALPWTLCFVGVAIAGNLCSIGNTPARIDLGLQLVTQPGEVARRFHQQLSSAAIDKPALVLVEDAGQNFHAEFVRNHPLYRDDIWVATDRPDLYSPAELRRHFPDRHLYWWHPHDQRFLREPIVTPLLSLNGEAR